MGSSESQLDLDGALTHDQPIMQEMCLALTATAAAIAVAAAAIAVRCRCTLVLLRRQWTDDYLSNQV